MIEYTDNPQYPEFIKFELIQDKCDLLNNYKVGDELDVHINLKGRKWTDPIGEVKYFNSLQAWRLEAASSHASTPNQPSPDSASMEGLEEPGWITDNEEDDLPF